MSDWDKFKTRRKRLRAVSAKERAHIDQASQEAVRLLTVLLLLVLASYRLKSNDRRLMLPMHS